MNNSNRNIALRRAGIIFLCFVISIITAAYIISLGGDKDGETVSAEVVAEKMLIPGGHSVGVSMEVKGVLIVGLEEMETINGEIVNPGLLSGLQIGDTIVSINDTKVYSAQEVQAIINEIKSDVELQVQRRDEMITIHLSPIIAKDDGLYKLGIWVKDKTAGIGTLTFYDPSDGSFGALGHGITDTESGTILPVKHGELLNSSVQSLKEGKSGNPGEIRGIFYEEEAPLGELKRNTQFGIFGNTYSDIENPYFQQPLKIAYQKEIKKGPAYILTTVEGNKIEKFNVEITSVNSQKEPDTKGLVIKVTDKELLTKTGGIIQGMSGSPIIQNNKIVGAVTHVFVRNPQMGYGVFIEWMLQ